jgi:hypothetical protein
MWYQDMIRHPRIPVIFLNPSRHVSERVWPTAKFSVSLQSLKQRQLPPPPKPPPNFSHISPRIKPYSESLTQTSYFGLRTAFKFLKKRDVSEAGKRPFSGKDACNLLDPSDRAILRHWATNRVQNKETVSVSHTASSKSCSVQASSGCTSLFIRKQKIYNYICTIIKNFLFIKSCIAWG